MYYVLIPVDVDICKRTTQPNAAALTAVRQPHLQGSALLWFTVNAIKAYCTDYGRPVRKSPSLHSRKSTPTLKLYGHSIFCLPHWPKFSDFFDLCLHWVSVVRGLLHILAAVFRQDCGYCRRQYYIYLSTLIFANKQHSQMQQP